MYHMVIVKKHNTDVGIPRTENQYLGKGKERVMLARVIRCPT